MTKDEAELSSTRPQFGARFLTSGSRIILIDSREYF